MERTSPAKSTLTSLHAMLFDARQSISVSSLRREQTNNDSTASHPLLPPDDHTSDSQLLLQQHRPQRSRSRTVRPVNARRTKPRIVFLPARSQPRTTLQQ